MKGQMAESFLADKCAEDTFLQGDLYTSGAALIHNTPKSHRFLAAGKKVVQDPSFINYSSSFP